MIGISNCPLYSINCQKPVKSGSMLLRNDLSNYFSHLYAGKISIGMICSFLTLNHLLNSIRAQTRPLLKQQPPSLSKWKQGCRCARGSTCINKCTTLCDPTNFGILSEHLGFTIASPKSPFLFSINIEAPNSICNFYN